MSLEHILHHFEKTRSLQSSDDMQLTRFLGFALWYLLLLSCCLVPIMCAYRRNRRLSLVVRNAHLRRMAAMGAFQLSDNRTVNYVTSQAARVDKERKVQDAISKTTMVRKFLKLIAALWKRTLLLFVRTNVWLVATSRRSRRIIYWKNSMIKMIHKKALTRRTII